MKITEIANEARKIIKQLQDLYVSYSVSGEKYEELVKLLSDSSNTTDVDVLKEVSIIRVRLYDELMKILAKSFDKI
jgi:hypothetical protein